jgi:hypothetical protein
MSKAIVTIGFENFVVDGKDALTLLDILKSAELYEECWRKAEDGGATHHVYQQDTFGRSRRMYLLSESEYKMAKLAGKPTKE